MERVPRHAVVRRTVRRRARDRRARCHLRLRPAQARLQRGGRRRPRRAVPRQVQPAGGGSPFQRAARPRRERGRTRAADRSRRQGAEQLPDIVPRRRRRLAGRARLLAGARIAQTSGLRRRRRGALTGGRLRAGPLSPPLVPVGSATWCARARPCSGAPTTASAPASTSTSSACSPALRRRACATERPRRRRSKASSGSERSRCFSAWASRPRSPTSSPPTAPPTPRSRSGTTASS